MTMIAPAVCLKYWAPPETYNFDQDWKVAKVLDLISAGPRRRVRQARYHPHRNAGACDAMAVTICGGSTQDGLPEPDRRDKAEPNRPRPRRHPSEAVPLSAVTRCAGPTTSGSQRPSCDVVVVAEQPVVSACGAGSSHAAG